MAVPPFFSNHIEAGSEQEHLSHHGAEDHKTTKPTKTIPRPATKTKTKHSKPTQQPKPVSISSTSPKLLSPSPPSSSSFSFRFPSWDVSAFTLPLFPELGPDFHAAGQNGHHLKATTTKIPFVVFTKANKIRPLTVVTVTKTSVPMTTTKPFIIFTEKTKIDPLPGKTASKPAISTTTTAKPKKSVEIATVKPFVSFGSKGPTKPIVGGGSGTGGAVAPSTFFDNARKTTSMPPSQLWSVLPPLLPKNTTKSPAYVTTSSQRPPNIKRVKIPKNKVKPFVFLGKKKVQTEVYKVKSSVPPKINSPRPTLTFAKVVTTKVTRRPPPVTYFKKVATTQVPKPPSIFYGDVKSTSVPVKIFNVQNKFTTVSTTTRMPKTTTKRRTSKPNTRRKSTPISQTTTTTTRVFVKKESTTTSTLKPSILVTEPFFPITNSDQGESLTVDKSEKLTVATENSEDNSDKEENNEKTFSMLVSALGVPDIWDVLLFGRNSKVQSQNIHHSGITSMQPLE